MGQSPALTMGAPPPNPRLKAPPGGAPSSNAERRTPGWLSWLREHPAVLLAPLPIALAVFDLRFHEFWRDEASPTLVGRAVPWDMFFVQMRVEGIPFLFHALMKIACYVLAPSTALVVVGAMGWATLLFGTYRLLLAISGERSRSALLTFFFSLTYVYAYELGVVIRQYALGLGLALLSMAYLREGLRTGARRAVVLGTIAGALSALLSAHSACVAGGSFAAFGLLALARRDGIRLGFPVIFALPSFALTGYMAQAFVGRTTEYNAHDILAPAEALVLSLQLLVKSLGPADWWLADFLPETTAGLDRVAALRDLAVTGALVGAAAALVARAPVLVRRWRVELFDVLAIVIGWVPLLDIVAAHYWGFFRHHLFFSTPAMVILAGWAADSTVAPRFTGALRRSWFVLAAPWFVFQIGLAAANVALDRYKPFADTKTFAALLPPEARVVAEADWFCVGMLLWRPDIQMVAANGGGRHFSYVIADNAWHAPVPIIPLVKNECTEAPDRVVFAGGRPAIPECMTPIENPDPESHMRPMSWETYSMWRVDCACALRH